MEVDQSRRAAERLEGENLSARRASRGDILRTAAARLEEVLAQIREQGYACDDEESEIGLYCLAAPIRDMNGDVVAAVSISGPAERMKENREKNIALVKQTALDITRSIS